MKKIILNRTIYFYDENNNEKMHIDYSSDECIWYFQSEEIIKITPNMEIYNVLDDFMKQDYIFADETFLNYKDKNKLIWYSDCYYNPDDEWSIASVSCLNIEKKENSFNIWCTRKIDEKISRPRRTYCICFSPCQNGRYSKNINTGLTLQDDFVINVYQKLLTQNKILKKIKHN